MSAESPLAKNVTENAPEKALKKTSSQTVLLSWEEFDSLCQRANMANRLLSRFCAALQTIRRRTKLKNLSQKRLARMKHIATIR